MINQKTKRKIKNKRGMALVGVIMISIVLMILTSSAVAMVYSDTMFSNENENSTKAYHLANSALNTVAEAIKKQVFDNTSDLQVKRALIMDNNPSVGLIAEINLLTDNFNNGTINADTQLAYDNEKAILLGQLATAISSYNAALLKVTNYVLPNVIGEANSYFHEVSLNLPTGSTVDPVKVTAIDTDSNGSIDAYLLKASASVTGMNSTGTATAAMKLSGIQWGTDVKSYETTTVTSGSITVNIPPTSSANFKYPIYAFSTIEAKKNFSAKNEDGTTGTVAAPRLKDISLKSNIGANKVADNSLTIINPISSMIPVDLTQTIFTTQRAESNLRKNPVTEVDNGYYGQWSGGSSEHQDTLKVNTNDGNVVLKFDSISIDKDFEIDVTGSNNLYLYVIGSVEFDKDIQISASNGAEIYLVSPHTSTIRIKKQGNLEMYIYTPYANVTIDKGEKDNSVTDFTGAIVSKSFYVDKDFKIKYVKPSDSENVDSNAGGGGTTITIPGGTTLTPSTIGVTIQVVSGTLAQELLKK